MKNVKLKKFLKNTVFKTATFFNAFIPKRNDIILLYSANQNLGFNLLPLKDYLLENGYQNKYLIFCSSENKKKDNKVVENIKNITQIKSFILFFRTKYVFYTDGQIPIKPSKNQIAIMLTHGACTLKTLGSLTKIHNGDENYFTYITFTSDIYKPIIAQAYNCLEENVLVNSEPMTDIFFKKVENYDLGNYKKIILWTPTFRQSDYLGYDDSYFEEILPTFKNNDYDNLNKFLKAKKVKLIVKLHPMQNVTSIDKFHYSNLDIFTHDSFMERGYDLYKLMMQVDALLGDYSSTMLQSLLIDIPLGYVIPDVEEYITKRGFVFDNYLDFMPGRIIKNQAQFFNFINDVVLEIDEYKILREKTMHKIHQYHDGLSCQRILEVCGIRKDPNV